jgi:hypothetical protein
MMARSCVSFYTTVKFEAMFGTKHKIVFEYGLRYFGKVTVEQIVYNFWYVVLHERVTFNCTERYMYMFHYNLYITYQIFIQ